MNSFGKWKIPNLHRYISYKKKDGFLPFGSIMFIEGFQALTRKPDGSPTVRLPSPLFVKRAAMEGCSLGKCFWLDRGKNFADMLCLRKGGLHSRPRDVVVREALRAGGRGSGEVIR
ncbi:hypothetical protein AKJ55_01490 [candidate division MSBL1 archaeon SCGC-AAA382M17]|uniref:Uncharacterized protein n=1 Tax=candidate division MSBL1 archaeon SCGC-AAA382M17 TaxID=1698284 RepID=A0ABR5TJC2_9EURY|nr:hypothetical protein AKJ55_01490 [candidate division MSBL1 archaeon SCGC-AAA382M17]